MRISLCVICGNEEAIIERLLESFGPGFDEFSLCRAVGSSAPDRSKDLAQAWCEKNGRAFRFAEYKNGPGAETWTHIDDFSAARNMAFENATGDWLFWADCDDVCDQPAKLREVLGAADVGDLVRFDYDVVGTNKRPKRERAIRRELFKTGSRWVYPVHENLRVPAGTRVTDGQWPVWVHQPKFVGPENRRRNKMILSRTLSQTANNYFYVHQEWFCEGNRHNAVRFGRLVLEFPDLEPSFRYETNLNLAKLAPDPDQALRYAMDAHSVFPWCREAMAMVALIFMERNDPQRALHWAERLDRTPEPPESLRPWTHEPKWYGWAAVDMLARCQRFADRPDDAKLTQQRLGPPTFSLIHATRGRPTRAAECRNQWLNLAANPERIEHLLCVDADDEKSVRIAKQYQHVISNSQSCVAAWNAGAAASRGKILIQLSDDWIPVPGWDAKILAEIERAGKTLDDEWVLAISDGHRKDDLLCMAILSRARYDRQKETVLSLKALPYVGRADDISTLPPPAASTAEVGPYLFHPDYESVFSDNEFTHRAYKDGVVIDARERLTFTHAHPVFGAGKWDATYEHNNRKDRYERGKATFNLRNPEAAIV